MPGRRLHQRPHRSALSFLRLPDPGVNRQPGDSQPRDDPGDGLRKDDDDHVHDGCGVSEAGKEVDGSGVETRVMQGPSRFWVRESVIWRFDPALARHGQ